MDANRKTEFIQLKGKGKFVQVKGMNPWKKWTVTLYPDPDSLEVMRDLQAKGIKNRMRKDDDGYHMIFNRPSEKEIEEANGMKRLIYFSPVEVTDAEGKPFDNLIGHGSDLTITLEIYQHNTPAGGKAIAARLYAVRVDHLVPYNPISAIPENLKPKPNF